MLSNGLYKSIEHRAMINTEKERISLAAFHFHNPDNSAMLHPLPEVVGDDKPNYRSIRYDEYMNAYLNQKLQGKSMIDTLRL